MSEQSKLIRFDKFIEMDGLSTEAFFRWGTINGCRCYGMVFERQTYDLTNYLNLTDYNKAFAEQAGLSYPDDQTFIVQLTNKTDDSDKMYIVFRYEDIAGWTQAEGSIIPDAYKYDGYLKLASDFKAYDALTLGLLGRILVVFNKAGNGVVPVLVPVSKDELSGSLFDCLEFNLGRLEEVARDARSIISNIEITYPAVNLEEKPNERYVIVKIDDEYYIFNRNHQGYAGNKAHVKIAIGSILNLMCQYYDAIKSETIFNYYNGYNPSNDNGIYVQFVAPVSGLSEAAATREDVNISGKRREFNMDTKDLFGAIGLAKPE